MAEEWLTRTLRNADRQLAGFGPPPDAQRLRSRAARRRHRSSAAWLVFLLTATGLTAFLATHLSIQHRPDLVKSPPPAIPPPLPTLDLSIDQRIALETQIRLDHRLLAAQAHAVASIDPAEQRDQAARIMVYAARQRQEAAGPQEAADLYQRTIALFPETPSADTASLALAQLQPHH